MPDVDRPWDTQPKTSSPEHPVRRWVVPFAVVGTITIGIRVWATVAPDDDIEEDDPALRQAGAEGVCQEFVKDRLKAPSTADFDTAATGFDTKWR